MMKVLYQKLKLKPRNGILIQRVLQGNLTSRALGYNYRK